MLQSIGFIIGFYVLTRMIELFAERRTEKRHRATLVFAVITVVVDIVMMLSLLAAGSGMPAV